ncbi:MAG: transposase of ISPca5, Tnp [candidate division NC10 bacterium]|nr:transposase of ISPca5, Tnp [candidate division NC10 bacterium]
MPRQPRLDAPGTLHHVMVRGIERTALFRDDRDRTDFVARLATLAETGAWVVYAWALVSNHAHLLVRTGRRPLGRSMRSLLTGYAGAFNRRYHRVGHLFHNRYKSIVVEDDPYLVELVRYLHLNPLRAEVVADLRALDRFPWTGHSALLGRVARPWQDTATILSQFGPTRARAIRAYRAFVAAGIPHGRRPDLQGGGLLRSHGGWAAVAALRRGREAYQGDERILGSSAFVEGYRRAAATAAPTPPRLTLDTILARVGRSLGVPPTALAGGGRTPTLTRARAGIAYLWVEVLGRSGRALAPALGVHPSAIPKAARRGARAAAEWRRVLGRNEES